MHVACIELDRALDGIQRYMPNIAQVFACKSFSEAYQVGVTLAKSQTQRDQLMCVADLSESLCHALAMSCHRTAAVVLSGHDHRVNDCRLYRELISAEGALMLWTDVYLDRLSADDTTVSKKSLPDMVCFSCNKGGDVWLGLKLNFLNH
jgi:hypothetical protein